MYIRIDTYFKQAISCLKNILSIHKQCRFWSIHPQAYHVPNPLADSKTRSDSWFIGVSNPMYPPIIGARLSSYWLKNEPDLICHLMYGDSIRYLVWQKQKLHEIELHFICLLVKFVWVSGKEHDTGYQTCEV